MAGCSAAWALIGSLCLVCGSSICQLTTFNTAVCRIRESEPGTRECD
jgi:hypothetical protein